MKFKLFAFLTFLLFLNIHTHAEEYDHPAILSFESGIDPAIASENSVLSVSREHFKHKNKSLHWLWTSSGSHWSIRQPVPYKLKKTSDNGVSTFVFWIYSAEAFKNGAIKVEFLKNGKVCSFFYYGINFTGWRGAWIAFDRDMQGTPQEGMDEMRVTALGCEQGELYFDHIILATDEDSRQHTADLQAPYVNPLTNSHWLILLRSWNKKFDYPLIPETTDTQLADLKKIEDRLKSFLLEGKSSVSIDLLAREFEKYRIKQNSDGTITGIPVFFERYGETYLSLGGPDYRTLFNNPSGLAKANQLLLNLAIAFQKTNDEKQQRTVANMFVLLMRHLLDQGFQAGSSMGTLHHLGYSMRDFYTAAFLMKDELKKVEIDFHVQQAMEWFAGTGEVKSKPERSGMDIDAFNTSLLGRLSSLLMMRDSADKVRYMRALTGWIENGFLYTDGTMDAFKPDGSIFHHRANYPAYAIGGLEGAVTANYLLSGTDFQLNPEGRRNLKNALLSMRIYCNLQTWPLSLSGRHPDGEGHLIPEHYALMALTGTPNYSEKTDSELAAAYLRLETNPEAKYRKIFTQQGITPEQSPEGNWSFSYSCLNIHRRSDWMVSAMGHSRYLWASEIYPGANMYGRYLNYGNLQIISGENPISNFGSGFNQKGWDWNHFPGTTATELPLSDLRANIRNVDSSSGFEEMLLSDESFAGSISFLGKQGIFAMKLRENPKYGGTLRARKSFFFFDNRIIALGSNISSEMPERRVHTTLFQVFLPDSSKAISVNGADIHEFPYLRNIQNKLTHLSDGLNNHFFVSDGKVIVQKLLQQSKDEETEKPTANNFAIAYIDHGSTPRNGSYHYLVLVQPTQDEQKAVIARVKSLESICNVLQLDSIAHIVFDRATNITSYVFFESVKLFGKTNVQYVSKPCLVMESVRHKTMQISVSDPDLHLYEGNADVLYDSVGKPLERSIYSMSWINNPAADSTVELWIRGKWELAGKYDFVQTVEATEKLTKIKVICNANRTITDFSLLKL